MVTLASAPPSLGIKSSLLLFVLFDIEDFFLGQVFKYLAGFDIVVHEMFGQSENCGLLTANIPKR